MLARVFFCIAALACATAWAQAPAIMLAQPHTDAIKVQDYWVSEKLDGVRARWDGQKLISRGGKTFAAPDWFVANFPATVMDGELWSGRNAYQQIASITAQQTPHAAWQTLRFMVFDLPKHGGSFSERVDEMQTLAAPYLQPIEQFRVSDNAALMQRLDSVIAEGGEGLMLHHQDARYEHKRSHQLLKLKRFDDAEATVIGYREGKGKYQGLVGSLQVRNAQGQTFYIGSGLSDAQRRNPPAIGSVVTYKHQGFTDSGKPRFPVYLRQRQDLN